MDPELIEAFNKLGIPLEEQKVLAGVAVDAVIDSVSVATTFQKQLEEHGVIFCPISEAIRKHPDLVKKYIGSVVPYTDNFFASLNSAVFSDGTFCYVPPGVRCPVELMTYFRINAESTGQFERTLIIADKGSYVSYLEGCTAPMRKTSQLHAAVVELIALDDAEIKYSTLQNWYPGDKDGKGGVYNFVTKRGKAAGVNSKISWTQVETGSAITWKYPSVHPAGRQLRRRVLLRGAGQQLPAGGHRHEDDPHGQEHEEHDHRQGHLRRPRTEHLPRSRPHSAHGRERAQLHALRLPADRRQTAARTRCRTSRCRNPTAHMEHEATTSRISEDQLFYLVQRGIPEEDAQYMIINGFCKGVFAELPFEFAMEAAQLLKVSLEGTVG